MVGEREVLAMKKRKMKGMWMRRAFCSVTAVAMVVSSLAVPQGTITAYAEEVENTPQLTAEVDAQSSYSATQIKNGNFEATPWEDFIINGVRYTKDTLSSSVSGTITASFPNGVGEGWNTTETQPYQGNLFEVWPTDKPLDSKETGRDFSGNGTKFIEMNTTNPACLYQDLATRGGRCD